jgi:hypothetical protein
MLRPELPREAGPWRHFCDTCWSAIPGWLRRYIAQEKDACRLAKTAHSDRLLQLRDMAIKELAKPPEEKKAS